MSSATCGKWRSPRSCQRSAVGGHQNSTSTQKEPHILRPRLFYQIGEINGGVVRYSPTLSRRSSHVVLWLRRWLVAVLLEKKT